MLEIIQRSTVGKLVTNNIHSSDSDSDSDSDSESDSEDELLTTPNLVDHEVSKKYKTSINSNNDHKYLIANNEARKFEPHLFDSDSNNYSSVSNLQHGQASPIYNTVKRLQSTIRSSVSIWYGQASPIYDTVKRIVNDLHRTVLQTSYGIVNDLHRTILQERSKYSIVLISIIRYCKCCNYSIVTISIIL